MSVSDSYNGLGKCLVLAVTRSAVPAVVKLHTITNQQRKSLQSTMLSAFGSHETAVCVQHLHLSGNGMPDMPDDTSDVSCRKTAEPIETPFVLWAPVGSRNHVLDGGPDPPMRRSNF